jgi:2-dehydropantoate 2-reductase
LPSSPRIAFVGAGAQGAGVAADLIRAGLDVVLIEQWPAHVEAMRRRGIEVRMPQRTEITPVTAFHLCEVAEMRDRFDMIFLLVKAYDTRWAVELVKPLLAHDGVVIGLQNGMTIDDVASIVGRRRTVGAVIEMASNMWEPGIINRQNAPENSWFAVGALDPADRNRAEEVREFLNHSGTVEVSQDIRSSKWMKLVANAGELVPSAILDLPLAEAADLPGVRHFMNECGREAAEAALADGCRLVPIMNLNEVDAGERDYAARLLGTVLRDYSFPDTLTTVLQDWRKGRRAEAEEINGYIADVLHRCGGTAPFNQHTRTLARLIEAGDLKAGPHNVTRLLSLEDPTVGAGHPDQIEERTP